MAAASGFNAAVTGVVNPSDKTGGTLKFGASSDCDSYDPARTYYAYCWDVQRLFTRTLMGFAPKPGTEGTAVVPDMATAPGAVSADGLEWTYTLQAGLKFEDGSPITTADIKYGIQRLYAPDVINGGPALREWVDNPAATPDDLDRITLPDEAEWAGIRAPYLLY